MVKLGLAFIGLINSIYLLSIHLDKSAACIVGKRCSEVVHSAYGVMLGIPLPILGICFYLMMLYIFYENRKDKDPLIGLETLFLGLGSGFSIGLVWIQLGVLHSFCVFCTLSALIIWTLLFLTLRKKPSLSFTWDRRFLTLSVGLSIFLVLPIFTYLLLHQETGPSDSKLYAKTSIGNFTLSDIDHRGGAQIQKAQQAINDARSSILDTILMESEAQSLDVSMDDYKKTYINSQVTLTEDNIMSEFEKFKKRYPNVTKAQIREYLQFEEQKKVFKSHAMTLKKKYKVSYMTGLSIPIAIKTNPLGSPTQGPSKAPLKLIVFSDFLCSHCATFHEELDERISKNPDLFYVTYRQFPHSSRLSKELGKVAYCADKQKLFPEVARMIYKNQRSINKSNMNEYLSRLSRLDTEKLRTCLYSSKAQSSIEADLKEVKRLELKSTPTIIVNGISTNVEGLDRKIYSMTRNN